MTIGEWRSLLSDYPDETEIRLWALAGSEMKLTLGPIKASTWLDEEGYPEDERAELARERADSGEAPWVAFEVEVESADLQLLNELRPENSCLHFVVEAGTALLNAFERADKRAEEIDRG